MALTVCWSAKGGVGTTVVAACLALGPARPTVLIDVDGDLPLVLGVPEPSGQGLGDWFESAASPRAILDLAIDLDPTTRLVPRGHRPIDRQAGRWGELGRWLAASEIEFVADTGVGDPPSDLLASGDGAPDDAGEGEGDDADRSTRGRGRSLLVTRPCYLALTHANRMRTRVDGVVLIDEPGRGLGPADVETSIGAPIVLRIPLDPAVARAVDSGLLSAGLPGSVKKPAERAA